MMLQGHDKDMKGILLSPRYQGLGNRLLLGSLLLPLSTHAKITCKLSRVSNPCKDSG
jgi:hypothetical protein